MIVTKRQAKAPIGVSHFITACRLPKEDARLIEFDRKIEFKENKTRRRPKPQFAYSTKLVLISE